MLNLLRSFLLFCFVANVLLVGTANAHDLPGKVTVILFAKPDGDRLLVLARVPMDALTEVQLPLRGPGFVDFSQSDKPFVDAARIYLTESMRFFADGEDLGEGTISKLRVSPIGDKSFEEFARALAHVNEPPLTNADSIYWKQAFLDTLITYPIKNPSARFAFDPRLDRIGMETHTVLRFLPSQSGERAFNYFGNPGLVQLEPSWWYAFSRFVVLGFEHILSGIDHLLFLFCLIIPARSIRALIPVITAFTVAHSITLISSAFGFTPTALWFPSLIETLIALSVFYMACENMFGAKLHRRWLIVFCFGLIHGFGFSFILADRMQFAGNHLVSGLLAFNVGVELGQFLVLLIAVPLLQLFFKFVKNEKLGMILLSAIAAHSAWHWTTERGAAFLEYRWEWPTLDAAFFAAAMRWAMLLLGSAAVVWAMKELLKRFARSAPN